VVGRADGPRHGGSGGLADLAGRDRRGGPLGVGFGVFTSVDFVLMTDVLPTALDRGKDLGVINVANALPQVAAPVLAAPIVTYLGGYRALYLVAAVIGAAGAVLVRQIRGVD
jgi:MFS family permease